MSSLKPNRPKNRAVRNIAILVIAVVLIAIIAGVMVFNIPTNTTTEVTKKVNKQNITPIDAAKQFNPQNAIDFASKVCSLGGRCNGNDGELKAAELMENELKNKNISVTKEKVDLGDGKYTYNVIGRIEGTSNPDRYIIIGSHIDSPYENVVGATDDASAMGIQVEMARILANANTNKTILIIGFGAEELEYKGSQNFVEKHPDIVKNCDAMMDLNCVGAGDNVAPIASSNLPSSVIADPKLLELLQGCANELGAPLSTDQDAYPSDTYYFYQFNESKVPVVQIQSRPFKVPAWTEDNTPDKLSVTDMNNVGQIIIMATLKLSNFGF